MNHVILLQTNHFLFILTVSQNFLIVIIFLLYLDKVIFCMGLINYLYYPIIL